MAVEFYFSLVIVEDSLCKELHQAISLNYVSQSEALPPLKSEEDCTQTGVTTEGAACECDACSAVPGCSNTDQVRKLSLKCGCVIIIVLQLFNH